MTPSNESNEKLQKAIESGRLDEAVLPPPEVKEPARELELWRQYRLQQQRRPDRKGRSIRTMGPTF